VSVSWAHLVEEDYECGDAAHDHSHAEKYKGQSVELTKPVSRRVKQCDMME
jgi:hypothetical protein